MSDDTFSWDEGAVSATNILTWGKNNQIVLGLTKMIFVFITNIVHTFIYVSRKFHFPNSGKLRLRSQMIQEDFDQMVLRSEMTF